MRKLLDWPPVRFLREILEIYFGKRVSRSAAELAFFMHPDLFSHRHLYQCLYRPAGPGRGPGAGRAGGTASPESLGILADYITYISGNQSTGLLVGGIATTLFASSAAFRALMDIMDDIYGRDRDRGVRRIAASVVFSLLLLVTIYLSIVVVLTGEWLFHLAARLLKLPEVHLPWAWQWMRFLLLFCLVLVLVLLVYRIAAPMGKPRPPILTGAVLAALALVGASVIFSWFIGMSSRYPSFMGPWPRSLSCWCGSTCAGISSSWGTWSTASGTPIKSAAISSGSGRKRIHKNSLRS